MKYHEKTFALQQKLLSNGADREAEKIYSKNSGALLEWEAVGTWLSIIYLTNDKQVFDLQKVLLEIFSSCWGSNELRFCLTKTAVENSKTTTIINWCLAKNTICFPNPLTHEKRICQPSYKSKKVNLLFFLTLHIEVITTILFRAKETLKKHGQQVICLPPKSMDPHISSGG